MAGLRYPVARTDSIRMWGSAGDGGQRYMLGGILAGALDGRFVNGEIKTAGFWTAGGAYQHRWNKKLQSFLDYGHWENLDSGRGPLAAGGTTNHADRLLLNLIWNPWPRVRYFLEGIYGFGANQAGPGGSDTSREAFRLNIAGQISF